MLQFTSNTLMITLDSPGWNRWAIYSRTGEPHLIELCSPEIADGWTFINPYAVIVSYQTTALHTVSCYWFGSCNALTSLIDCLVLGRQASIPSYRLLIHKRGEVRI